MNDYVIIMDPMAAAADKNAVTAFLVSHAAAYWHWIDNVWLAKDVRYLTARRCYTALLSEFPSLNNKPIVIFDMKDRSYWGHAETEGWAWMEKYWKHVK